MNEWILSSDNQPCPGVIPSDLRGESSPQLVEHTSNGEVQLFLMNDLGVPVSGFSQLMFEVKACANAYLVLSERSSFANDKGNYFMIMLGASKNRINGIKDSCFKCSTFHAHPVKTTLDCDTFKPFFVTWDNTGSIKVGDDLNKEVFLHHQSEKNFSLNFLNVMSRKEVANWKFRIGK